MGRAKRDRNEAQELMRQAGLLEPDASFYRTVHRLIGVRQQLGNVSAERDAALHNLVEARRQLTEKETELAAWGAIKKLVIDAHNEAHLKDVFGDKEPNFMQRADGTVYVELPVRGPGFDPAVAETNGDPDCFHEPREHEGTLTCVKCGWTGLISDEAAKARETKTRDTEAATHKPETAGSYRVVFQHEGLHRQAEYGSQKYWSLFGGVTRVAQVVANVPGNTDVIIEQHIEMPGGDWAWSPVAQYFKDEARSRRDPIDLRKQAAKSPETVGDTADDRHIDGMQ